MCFNDPLTGVWRWTAGPGGRRGRGRKPLSDMAERGGASPGPRGGEKGQLRMCLEVEPGDLLASWKLG